MKVIVRLTFNRCIMLDHTWNLESKLKEVQCSDELKTLILEYIEKFHVKDIYQSFSGIIYRGNMYYILDNLDKPELINELNGVLNHVKTTNAIKSNPGT